MKIIPFAMICMWEKLLDSDPAILVWLKCKKHIWIANSPPLIPTMSPLASHWSFPMAQNFTLTCFPSSTLISMEERSRELRTSYSNG